MHRLRRLAHFAQAGSRVAPSMRTWFLVEDGSLKRTEPGRGSVGLPEVRPFMTGGVAILGAESA